MQNLAKSNHFKLNIHLSKQQFSSYLTFWKILLTYIVASVQKTNKCKWWLISCSFAYCFKIESKFQNIHLSKQKFSSYLTFWKILQTYNVANVEKTNKCK
jgi:hypothetical protein